LKKNKLNIKSIKNIDNINEYNTILEIAEFYFEDEQFIESIEFYKKIVQKNNNEYINKKLGYCYIYQSIIEYENFNFDKFNIYTIEAKKILKKEDFLEKQEYVNDSILQIENEKDFKNADKLIESNRIESAINIYKKINKNINSIFLYNKITNLYIQIRDLFSALEYIESATLNSYKKKEIQANLYYRLEKYDKLEEICNELIQDHPELISCYTLLGKYKVENDPEDALNFFSLALSIDPNSFPSIIGKGRTLLKLNKYKDSSLEFEKAIKLNCKKTSSTELLGCNLSEYRLYLESKFTEGMNWDNYGRKGWHIDHIIPCASFNLSDYNQQKQCFHYTNTQPLWWWDNLKKSAKY
jgi:tetratricopeptide (TPR) repeat protein